MNDNIVLVRHGNSFGNHHQVFLGLDHVNFLTPEGVNQALAVKFEDDLKFDNFFASRMLRSYNTLMMILCNYKRSWDPSKIELRQEFNEWYNHENEEQIMQRGKQAIDLLNQTQGNILVVSHDGFLRVIMHLIKHQLPEESLMRSGDIVNVKHCYPLFFKREQFKYDIT